MDYITIKIDLRISLWKLMLISERISIHITAGNGSRTSLSNIIIVKDAWNLNIVSLVAMAYFHDIDECDVLVAAIFKDNIPG